MKVLALEPYYGGSHKAFVDAWSQRSRHDWTLLHLPPHKWKWRMRHAAITFAEMLGQKVARGQSWDVLFCSDMLNLAEFLGLAPQQVRDLPAVVYFHENQLTYPVRAESERDYHFVLTNITTALAARGVWFNSAFHRDEFLGALPAFLKRMPDHIPLHAIDQIREKSQVHAPGVDELPSRAERPNGPLRILWAARWEHDKNPETFFEALMLLKQRDVPFRVSVIGEQFRECPAVFDEMKAIFCQYIDRWGYQPTRGDYEAALLDADVIVSTANHEFFVLSVVEAITAGAFPLLPRRLSYPEILAEVNRPDLFFYDGSANHLAAALGRLADRIIRGHALGEDCVEPRRAVERFQWTRIVHELDSTLESIVVN